MDYSSMSDEELLKPDSFTNNDYSSMTDEELLKPTDRLSNSNDDKYSSMSDEELLKPAKEEDDAQETINSKTEVKQEVAPEESYEEDIAKAQKRREELARQMAGSRVDPRATNSVNEIKEIDEKLKWHNSEKADDEKRTVAYVNGTTLRDGETYKDGNGEYFRFDYEAAKRGEDPRVAVSQGEYEKTHDGNDKILADVEGDGKSTKILKAEKHFRDERKKREAGEAEALSYLESKWGKKRGKVQFNAEELAADDVDVKDAEQKKLADSVKDKGGTLDHRNRPMHFYRDDEGKVSGYGTTNSTVVQELDGTWSVIPTIVGKQGQTVEMTPEKAAEHYRKTELNDKKHEVGEKVGERWGNFATEEEAKQAAKNIHDLHEKLYANKWHQYIRENWDDISDSVKDEGTRRDYEAWVKAGKPRAEEDLDILRARQAMAADHQQGEKRERGVGEDLIANAESETGKKQTLGSALAHYGIPFASISDNVDVKNEQERYERFMDGTFTDADLKDEDSTTARLIKNDPKFARMYGNNMIANHQEIKQRAAEFLDSTKLPWYKVPVAGAAKNFGYTMNFALSAALGGGLGASFAAAGASAAKVAAAARIGSDIASIVGPGATSAVSRFKDLTANEYEVNDDGSLTMTVEGDDNGMAATKAVVGGVSEAVIEKYLFDNPLTRKLANTGVAKKIRGNFMKSLAESKAGNAYLTMLNGFNKIKKYTATNGMLAEIGEEDAQAIVDDVFGMGRREDEEYTGSDTLTAKGQLDIFLNMFGTMAMQSAFGLGIGHMNGKAKQAEQKLHDKVQSIYDIPGLNKRLVDNMSDREKAKFLNLYNCFSGNGARLQEAADKLFGVNGKIEVALEQAAKREATNMEQDLLQRGVEPEKFNIPVGEDGKVAFKQKLIRNPFGAEVGTYNVAEDEEHDVAIVDYESGKFGVLDQLNNTVNNFDNLEDAQKKASDIVHEHQYKQLNDQKKAQYGEMLAQQYGANLISIETPSQFINEFGTDEYKRVYEGKSPAFRVGDTIYVVLDNIHSPADMDKALADLTKGMKRGEDGHLQPMKAAEVVIEEPPAQEAETPAPVEGKSVAEKTFSDIPDGTSFTYNGQEYVKKNGQAVIMDADKDGKPIERAAKRHFTGDEVVGIAAPTATPKVMVKAKEFETDNHGIPVGEVGDTIELENGMKGEIVTREDGSNKWKITQGKRWTVDYGKTWHEGLKLGDRFTDDDFDNDRVPTGVHFDYQKNDSGVWEVTLIRKDGSYEVKPVPKSETGTPEMTTDSGTTLNGEEEQTQETPTTEVPEEMETPEATQLTYDTYKAKAIKTDSGKLVSPFEGEERNRYIQARLAEMGVDGEHATDEQMKQIEGEIAEIEKPYNDAVAEQKKKEQAIKRRKNNPFVKGSMKSFVDEHDIGDNGFLGALEHYGVYSIPIDWENTHRGGKVAFSKDVATDHIQSLLDGYGGLYLSKNGKLYLKNSEHIPARLKPLFGNDFTIGGNDTKLQSFYRDILNKDENAVIGADLNEVDDQILKEYGMYQDWRATQTNSKQLEGMTTPKALERIDELQGLEKPTKKEKGELRALEAWVGGRIDELNKFIDENYHTEEDVAADKENFDRVNRELAMLNGDLSYKMPDADFGGGETYYLDELAARTNSEDAARKDYDEALVEVNRFEPKTAEVQAFHTSELGKLEKGDTIRFDHTSEEMDFHSFDNGVLTVAPFGTVSAGFDVDTKDLIKYQVTDQGFKKIGGINETRDTGRYTTEYPQNINDVQFGNAQGEGSGEERRAPEIPTGNEIQITSKYGRDTGAERRIPHTKVSPTVVKAGLSSANLNTKERAEAEEALKNGVVVSAIEPTAFREDDGSTFPVTSFVVQRSTDAARLFQHFYTTKGERAKVMYLGEKGEVLGLHIFDLGMPGESKIDTDYIMTHIPANSKKVIIAHNHPSGTPSVNDSDHRYNNKLLEMLKEKGLEFNALITDTDRYYDFADNQLHYDEIVKNGGVVVGQQDLVSANGNNFNAPAQLVASYLTSKRVPNQSWLVGMDSQMRITAVAMLPKDGDYGKVLEQMPQARTFAIGVGKEGFNGMSLIASMDKRLGKGKGTGRKYDADIFWLNNAEGIVNVDIGGDEDGGVMGQKFQNNMRKEIMRIVPTEAKEEPKPAVNKVEPKPTVNEEEPRYKRELRKFLDDLGDKPNLTFTRSGEDVYVHGKTKQDTISIKKELKANGFRYHGAPIYAWSIDYSMIPAGSKVLKKIDEKPQATEEALKKREEEAAKQREQQKKENAEKREAERSAAKERRIADRKMDEGQVDNLIDDLLEEKMPIQDDTRTRIDKVYKDWVEEDIPVWVKGLNENEARGYAHLLEAAQNEDPSGDMKAFKRLEAFEKKHRDAYEAPAKAEAAARESAIKTEAERKAAEEKARKEQKKKEIADRMARLTNPKFKDGTKMAMLAINIGNALRRGEVPKRAMPMGKAMVGDKLVQQWQDNSLMGVVDNASKRQLDNWVTMAARDKKYELPHEGDVDKWVNPIRNTAGDEVADDLKTMFMRAINDVRSRRGETENRDFFWGVGGQGEFWHMYGEEKQRTKRGRVLDNGISQMTLFEEKADVSAMTAEDKKALLGKRLSEHFFDTVGAEKGYGFDRFVEYVEGKLLPKLGVGIGEYRKHFGSWYATGAMDAPDEIDRSQIDMTESVDRKMRQLVGLPERGKDAPGRRVANVVQEHLMPNAPERVTENDYNHGLDADQRKGVNLALESVLKPNGHFMIADGTGFGKTRQILAIADQYKKANPNANVLIVTKSEIILNDSFAKDSAAMGVDTSRFTMGTYNGMTSGKFDDKVWDLVLMDEAHLLANPESQRTRAYWRMKIQHKVFATATPMDRPTDATYFMSELNNIDQEMLANQLGYRIEVRAPEGGDPYQIAVPMEGQDFGSIQRNVIMARDRAIAAGKMLRRAYPFLGEIDMDYHVPMNEKQHANEAEIIRYFDDEIKALKDKEKIWISGIGGKRGKYYEKKNYEDNPERWREIVERAKRQLLNQKYQSLDKLNESVKADTIGKVAAKILNENPKARVIIVGSQIGTQTINGGFSGKKQMKLDGFKFTDESNGRHYQIEPSLKVAARRLTMMGYGNDIAHIYTGYDKTAEQNDFLNGRKRILVMTAKSGGTGVNLDDTTGEHPTVMLCLNKDYSAKELDQLLGRVSRKNTKSEAKVLFITNTSAADAHKAKVANQKLGILKAIQGGADMDIVSGMSNDRREDGEGTLHEVKVGIEGAKNMGVDMNTLKDALVMERDGASRYDIWKKTGWYYTKDDSKWSIGLPIEYPEMADFIRHCKAEMITGDKTYNRLGASLGALVGNWEGKDGSGLEMLLKAYPTLKNTNIIFRKLNAAGGWAYKGEIIVDPNNGDQFVAGTMIHELSHAIQRMEGFNNGADWNDFVSKKLMGKDKKEAIEFINRHTDNENWGRHWGTIRGSVYNYQGYRFAPTSDDYENELLGIQRKLNPITDKDDLEKVNRWLDYLKKNSQMGRYARTGGEWNARIAEDRMMMTNEQRTTVPPWAMADSRYEVIENDIWIPDNNRKNIKQDALPAIPEKGREKLFEIMEDARIRLADTMESEKFRTHLEQAWPYVNFSFSENKLPDLDDVTEKKVFLIGEQYYQRSIFDVLKDNVFADANGIFVNAFGKEYFNEIDKLIRNYHEAQRRYAEMTDADLKVEQAKVERSTFFFDERGQGLFDFGGNEANGKLTQATLFEEKAPISAAEDAAYADAVKRGDRETALRMIREAAAKAMPNTKVVDKDGLPKVVYHATNRDFTVFRTPSYFADTQETVEGIKGYSEYGRIVPAFINIESPYKIDAEGAKWNHIYIPEEGYRSLNSIVESERQNGWKEYRADDTIVDVDGIIVLNVHEGDSGMYLTTDYIPKNPNQVKSADITYDDQGNLIPLSERFNPDNESILYEGKAPLQAEGENGIISANERPRENENAGGRAEAMLPDRFELVSRTLFGLDGRAEDPTDLKYESEKEYSSTDIKRLYDALNRSEDNQKLADRVFAIASELPMSYSFGDTSKYSNDQKKYSGLSWTGFAVLDKKTFADPYAGRQFKADTILHETIHDAIEYAFDQYETDRSKLNKELRSAIDTFNALYNMVKNRNEKLNIFKSDDYGLKDVHEFIAELSRKDFRDGLKKFGVWGKIMDAIAKMLNALGIHFKVKNAYDVSMDALDKFMSNYDIDLYDQHKADVEQIKSGMIKDAFRPHISNIYTGSAADYDKPSLIHVGTGEGTQVYGWGLYGSNVRGVAEGYAAGGQGNHTIVMVDGKEWKPSKDASIGEKTAYEQLDDLSNTPEEIAEYCEQQESERYKEAAKFIRSHKIEIREPHDYLYSQTFFTNRAPGDESHLLNWYEPVSKENTKRILDQARKEGIGTSDGGWYIVGGHNLVGATKGPKTATLYKEIVRDLGSPKAASEFLARADIDGIKYPVDSYGGKGVKDGDKVGWNYVSFRDDNIRVDHKWVDGEQLFEEKAEIAGETPAMFFYHNEAIDDWNVRRGLKEQANFAKVTTEELNRRVQRLMSNEKEMNDRIRAIEILPTGQPVSAEEQALIGVTLLKMCSTYGKMFDERELAKENGNDALADTIAKQMDAYRPMLERLKNANKKIGNAAGRALQARQLAVLADYTLAAVEHRAREANGGRPLPPEVQKELERLVRQADKAGILEDDEKMKALTTYIDSAIRDILAKADKEVKSKALTAAGMKKIKDSYDKALLAIWYHGTTSGGILVGLPRGKMHLDALQRYHLATGEAYTDGKVDEKKMVELIIADCASKGVDADEWRVRQILSEMGVSTTPPQTQLEKDRRELNTQHLIQQQMEYALKYGELPPVKGYRHDAPSLIVKALRKERDELFKRLGLNAGKEDVKLKTALDTMKTRLRNRIEELENAIKTGERIEKKEKRTYSDAELEALRAQLKDAKERYDEAFPPTESEELEKRLARYMSALGRSKKHWQEMLDAYKAGNFDKEEKDSPFKENEAVKNIKQEIEAIKTECKALKDAAFPEGTPDELAKKAEQRLRTINDAIDELDKKIDAFNNAKTFQEQVDALKKEPKKAPFMTEEISKAKELKKQKQAEIDEYIYNLAKESEGKAVKVREVLDTLLNVLPRSLRTMADFSQVLSQGWHASIRLAAQNPKALGRALKDTFKAFASQDKADYINNLLEQDLYFQDFKKMGGRVYGAVGNGGKVDEFRGAERKIGKFSVDMIPGVKQSERSFGTYLNALNTALYRVMVEGGAWDAGGPTELQRKDLSQLVSTATGSSTREGGKPSNEWTSALFFAPRFALATAQIASGYTFVAPFLKRRIKKNMNAEDTEAIKAYGTKQKLAVSKEAVKTLVPSMLAAIVFQSIINALMNPDDDKWEDFFDVRSSDFLSARVGNARFNLIKPITIWWTLMARVFGKTAHYGVEQDKGFNSIVGQTLRGKLGPFAGLLVDIVSGKDYVGNEIDWSKLSTQKKGDRRVGGIPHLIESFGVPMVISDIADVYKSDGAVMAAATAPFIFFGTRVSAYDDEYARTVGAADKMLKKMNNLDKQPNTIDKRYRELGSSITDAEADSLVKQYNDAIANADEYFKKHKDKITIADKLRKAAEFKNIAKIEKDEKAYRNLGMHERANQLLEERLKLQKEFLDWYRDEMRSKGK